MVKNESGFETLRAEAEETAQVVVIKKLSNKITGIQSTQNQFQPIDQQE